MPTTANPIIGTIVVEPTSALAGLARPMLTDDTSLGSLLASLSHLPELTAGGEVAVGDSPRLLTQTRWCRAATSCGEPGGQLRADLAQLLADLEAEYAALATRSVTS
jgi:hypothetical protein